MDVLEKILEEIDKKADYYETDEQGREHVRMVDMVEVEDIIRSNMNEVENDDWIPVEERSPEDNSKILCTTEYGEVVLCRYSWNNPHTKKKFFGVGGGAAYSGIIAWQPLPEGYKGDRNA